MFISAVFLGLSVLVVAYLLLYHREALFGSTRSSKAVGKRNKTENVKTILEIEDIRNSIVALTGNRYRMIVKVGSVDYALLSEGEQNALEEALRQTVLSFNYPVQFYVTTERIDTTNVLEQVQRFTSNPMLPENLRNYGTNMIQYLAEMMKDRGTYIRRNYIVIDCTAKTKEEAESELLRRANFLINSLNAAKIAASLLSTEEIMDVIHRALNKGSVATSKGILESGGFELYVTSSQA